MGDIEVDGPVKLVTSSLLQQTLTEPEEQKREKVKRKGAYLDQLKRKVCLRRSMSNGSP